MHLLEGIEAAAAICPEKVALAGGDNTKTYGSLWAEAMGLALWLADNTKERAPLVVYGHKDPMMVVCFFACVLAGHAYCPVDVSMPKERIADIVEAVDPEWILATEELPEGILSEGLMSAEAGEGPAVLDRAAVDRLTKKVGVLPSLKESGLLPVTGEETWYILFTSGSTGKPKGVEITCHCLEHFTDWSTGLGACEGDRVYMNQAPLSFDLSVMDLYSALATGSREYLLSSEVQKDMAALLSAFRESGITHWVSTPSFADLCLSDRNFDSGLLPDLKAFLFCGETLTKRTVSRLMERFPGVDIINTYGPTESTVAVTDVRITKEMLEAEEDLPVGAEKPGTRITIDGTTGEMHIIGDTVAKGYFHDEEKTKAAFFTAEEDLPKTAGAGSLMRGYRTGDAGFRKDGLLYYKGRLDRQVKLHGYRIELGDIETNLMAVPGVSMAAVVAKVLDGKVRYLAGFVAAEEGAELDRKSLRAALLERLPAYMVPKKLIVKDSLPLTGNGKIDRKALEASLL